jgi:hypothetical protein
VKTLRIFFIFADFDKIKYSGIRSKGLRMLLYVIAGIAMPLIGAYMLMLEFYYVIIGKKWLK